MEQYGNSPEIKLTLEAAEENISRSLLTAQESLVAIGYYLRAVRDQRLYQEHGYLDLQSYAKQRFGFSSSAVSRYIAINERFSENGNSPKLDSRYAGYGKSQLQEMLTLDTEALERVTPDMTVRQIRELKPEKTEEPALPENIPGQMDISDFTEAEELSYFGLRKTVRPEGSLLSTPGCGDGRYDCFLCVRPCGIRQEARRCRLSTCGNPKPCGIIDNEDWKKKMQYSMYKDECQMLYLELAPKRAGDGEPDACCRNCPNKACFNRCDVAKTEDEAERKRQQEKIREQQQKAEAEKPEPSDGDIKDFCDWSKLKPTDTITAEELKAKYRYAGGGGGARLKDYRGSQRGIRINYKREITWAQLAKRIKEIREKELEQLEQETGFTEEDFLKEFYRNTYTSIKAEIKNRDKAAITKLFKQEYGNTYESGSIADGGSYNCYPDKIVFREAPGEEGLQITWGKLVTKLINLLDNNPEIEGVIPNNDAKQPEITYSKFDVMEVFKDAKNDYDLAVEADMPEYFLQTCKIKLDAVELLLEKIKETEGRG